MELAGWPASWRSHLLLHQPLVCKAKLMLLLLLLLLLLLHTGWSAPWQGHPSLLRPLYSVAIQAHAAAAAAAVAVRLVCTWARPPPATPVS